MFERETAHQGILKKGPLTPHEGKGAVFGHPAMEENGPSKKAH